MTIELYFTFGAERTDSLSNYITENSGAILFCL
uniref:Uncharacterized protein n=1 Tax=Aegilops tauschii subsp. strangulata TaxID=200361 RepID=A0A453P1M8_AEGTS